MRKKRRTNPAPAGILLLAVLIRLACEPGLLPSAAARLAAPAAATADAGAEAEAPDAINAAAEPAAAVQPLDLQIPAAAEAASQPVTLALREEAAQGLDIRNHTGYTVSLQELAGQALQFDANAGGPTVLILHTHTTEAYTPEPGWEYEASDVMRTMDSRYNMVRIGDEVEQILTDAGLWVIHDERINDYPSYNGSYGTALGRIEAWLERYPSIQVVLDLHRDAAEDAEGRYVATSCTASGADAAQLMLVCGTDYGGLPHPNWRGNLAFAAQLQLALEQADPGICRPLDLRCERFNQHATAMSLLVEVGSVGDTLARALPAAQSLGRALARLLTQA